MPGHMLIGWIGQYLEDWCGDPRLILSWTVRFTAPVWPGDQFTLRGEVAPDSSSGDIRTVTVTATSQEGKACGVATAVIRVQPS